MSTHNNKKIKVILADDHQMVLEGLEAILMREDDIEIVGTALDGEEVMELMRHQPVDVVILDIDMPRKDGTQTLGEIRAEFPHTHALALTMHKEPPKIKAMLELGVRGYILKNRSGKDLVAGIRAVMREETYWGPDVSKSIMDAMASIREDTERPKVKITDMEAQVLELLAEGMTTKEMADQLCRAPSTVETHKNNLKKKLNISNEKLLVRYAVENGYVRKP